MAEQRAVEESNYVWGLKENKVYYRSILQVQHRRPISRFYPLEMSCQKVGENVLFNNSEECI